MTDLLIILRTTQMLILQKDLYELLLAFFIFLLLLL